MNESWRWRDPFEVVASMERHAQKQTARAIRQAASIFEDDMGRKILVPGHVEHAMFQWGDWARRPQFWENLGPTPFYKLLPLPDAQHHAPNTRLDSQSHYIQKAVYRLESERTRNILYARYVVMTSWAEHRSFFLAHGVTNQRFIDEVKAGSVAVYNAAMRQKAKDGALRKGTTEV